MKNIKRGTILITACFFISAVSLSAQGNQYSVDQIIGKWVLKSALFNGNAVPVENMDERMSFEFTSEGAVTFITPAGKAEKGKFTIEENMIIDPVTPEQPGAEIISLANNILILSMIENSNKMILTFELMDVK